MLPLGDRLAAGAAHVLTGPLTLVRTPPAGEAGDCFGLALAAVPAAAPVLWPPPWPGMMSWVTAWTAEATVLVAVGAGDGSAPPLDPADAGAGALAAGTFAAGTFAAGTFAAGTAWEEAALAGVPWSLLPPGAGLPGAVLTGPELPPSPELPPWPEITLWAELITELTTEPAGWRSSGWLAEFGWAACCEPEAGPGWTCAWLLLPPGAGLPGAALTGPELPPSPELPPWPAITLWAELVTELATEPAAELTGEAGPAARSTRSERAEAACRRARGRCGRGSGPRRPVRP